MAELKMCDALAPTGADLCTREKDHGGIHYSPSYGNWTGDQKNGTASKYVPPEEAGPMWNQKCQALTSIGTSVFQCELRWGHDKPNHFATAYGDWPLAPQACGHVWCNDKCSLNRPISLNRPLVDNVNSPKHYTAHKSGVECITITESMNFCLGNALKYIWRADEKGNALEDLKKARWYIEREIARREKIEKGKTFFVGDK